MYVLNWPLWGNLFAALPGHTFLHAFYRASIDKMTREVAARLGLLPPVRWVTEWSGWRADRVPPGLALAAAVTNPA